MLTITKIEGRTPITARYDTGYFISDGHSYFSYTRELGFLERHDINRAKLDRHIQRMKDEGFTVTIQEV